MAKPLVIIGFLGTNLDRVSVERRWDKWRPTVDLCRHDDMLISRLELIRPSKFVDLTAMVTQDISAVSPGTTVVDRPMDFADPWDFEEVFSGLHGFCRTYPFDPDEEDYLIHVTTGTHVQQICLFLLTESRHFPGRLIQSSPRGGSPGTYSVIDLDLSRYDQLARRFAEEQAEGTDFLKSGIQTLNADFNALIDRMERVAIRSQAPILLMGPTGAGKSHLARRIVELKRHRRQIRGRFVEVNCATLRGDGAMSALFGHVRGAYTGAGSDRAGLLKTADGGVLFLDEIGELGLDEQAMLLRAIEEKRFLPVGSDREVESDFQLLAGTNRDLWQRVREGRFREDLLARVNLWTFELPGLAERHEDIEPNLEYELSRVGETTGTRTTFNREGRRAFLQFATSPEATWPGNFRDFNAALTRMGTLAPGGRINEEVVDDEVRRLRRSWRTSGAQSPGPDILESALSRQAIDALDRFDRVQLTDVLTVCRKCRTLSEAGRMMFSESRKTKKSPNDADRLRKYLARFGLSWKGLTEARASV